MAGVGNLSVFPFLPGFPRQRGVVLWEISLPMALGQLVGGVLGANLAMKGGARLVRIFVLVVSGALILKLIFDLVG